MRLFVPMLALTLLIVAAVVGASETTTGRKLQVAKGCVCTAVYKPVCGLKNGVRRTYPNACAARCDGAAVVEQEACSGGASTQPVRGSGGRKLAAPADGTLGGKCGGFVGIPCKQGLACMTPPNTADAFGTCQYNSPVVGKGESCGGRRIGPSPVCAAGLYCKTNPQIADAPGVCTRNPRSGVGEPCGGFPPPDMPLPTCKPGLTCKTNPNVPDKPGVCQ